MTQDRRLIVDRVLLLGRLTLALGSRRILSGGLLYLDSGPVTGLDLLGSRGSIRIFARGVAAVLPTLGLASTLLVIPGLGLSLLLFGPGLLLLFLRLLKLFLLPLEAGALV